MAAAVRASLSQPGFVAVMAKKLRALAAKLKFPLLSVTAGPADVATVTPVMAEQSMALFTLPEIAETPGAADSADSAASMYL